MPAAAPAPALPARGAPTPAPAPTSVGGCCRRHRERGDAERRCDLSAEASYGISREYRGERYRTDHNRSGLRKDVHDALPWRGVMRKTVYRPPSRGKGVKRAVGWAKRRRRVPTIAQQIIIVGGHPAGTSSRGLAHPTTPSLISALRYHEVASSNNESKQYPRSIIAMRRIACPTVSTGSERSPTGCGRKKAARTIRKSGTGKPRSGFS